MIEAKQAVESHLQNSGLTYTILRPTKFTEVWLSPSLGFNYPAAEATLYGTGEKPITYISLGDVAEFAVRSFRTPEARNAVLSLGGPEPISPLQVVQIFEAEAGRPFTVKHVPQGVLEAQYEAAPDPLAKSFTALMVASALGDEIPMAETARTFGVTLTSVREYARRVAGQAQAQGA